jgi:hypothetical protein
MRFLRRYAELRFSFYRENVFKMLRLQFRDFKDV